MKIQAPQDFSGYMKRCHNLMIKIVGLTYWSEFQSSFKSESTPTWPDSSRKLTVGERKEMFSLLLSISNFFSILASVSNPLFLPLD